jgi:hypothetical protein
VRFRPNPPLRFGEGEEEARSASEGSMKEKLQKLSSLGSALLAVAGAAPT